MLCSRVCQVCQCYRGTRTPQHCWYLRTRSRRVVYLGHLYLRIQSQSCGVPSDWVVAPDPFAMHEPHLGSGPWALGPGHHHTTHSATHWHTTGTSATSAGLAHQHLTSCRTLPNRAFQGSKVPRLLRLRQPVATSLQRWSGPSQGKARATKSHSSTSLSRARPLFLPSSSAARASETTHLDCSFYSMQPLHAL